MKRVLSGLIICAILTSVYIKNPSLNISYALNQEQYSEKNGVDENKEISAMEYMRMYANSPEPTEKISLEGEDFTGYLGDQQPTVQKIEGQTALVISDTATVKWEFTAEVEGVYDIWVTYYPIEGKGATIERKMLLDDKLPYKEARNITFLRIWENQGEKIYSTKGNEFRRPQKELKKWITSKLYSNVTYNDSALRLYLSAGKHTISFESISEPIAISKIEFYNESPLLTYDQLLEKYKAMGYKEYSSQNEPLVLQGEDAKYKSNNNLYAVEDRTSYATDPSDISKIRLNCIGGSNWAYKHQWLEWEVDIPQDAFYRISLRVLQDFVSGANAYRTLSIDGKVPFAEAENIVIPYNLNWQIKTLGKSEGDYYLIPLEKGIHTIRLTNTLGDIGLVLEQLNDCLVTLNKLYRDIIMITGTIPDRYRDYKLTKNIPDMNSILQSSYEVLNNVEEKLVQISRKKGEQTVNIDRLIVQIETFLKRPQVIPLEMAKFSENINAVNSWMSTGVEVGVLIDKLVLMSPDSPEPQAELPFYKSWLLDIKSFVVSFFVDYYSIDNFFDSSGKKNEEVTLWLAGGSGRDQANVIKNISDYNFTQEKGINLNIRLVDMDALLRAVASSTGPDIALFQAQSQALNYGIRGAAYDLNQFPDIDEVKNRFAQSAIIPLEYDGKLYGLPEQQTFPMMFYRLDVFEELGITYPNTWNEFYKLIPILDQNSLTVGLPTPTLVQSGASSTGINSMYSALLMQNGADIYNQDGSRCVLDSLDAINAFITWSEFYTKYNLPKTYSPINRFRTGEMPLIITDYTFYNTLVVAAPDIQGLWAIVPIPGTEDGDGIINRKIASNISCAIMFSNARNKQASWEFLKWWTSAEGQVLYGQEIEALQGSSARWATANLEAMKQLPWNKRVSDQIQLQWQQVEGIAEVPGGYYVGRSIDNAIKSVINLRKNPRETILDAVDSINEEIIIKRREFGLE